MDAPRLEISRQDAEFEITTHKARVEISTRRSQFRMTRNLARFRVDKRLPTMRLDRTAMYSALGIGPVLQSARQYFQDAMQQSIENTGLISSDGDALMRIESGGNTIADLGAQAVDTGERSVNTMGLPTAEVNWEPGYININWTPGSLEMEWDTSSWADIRVEPHYIEIRMKKYPEVRIRVTYDSKGKQAGGKYVDKYL